MIHDFENFYLDSGNNSPIHELKKNLLYEMDYPKFLLTGPAGFGKSVELLQLAVDKEISRHFRVKILSASDPPKHEISKIDPKDF